MWLVFKPHQLGLYPYLWARSLGVGPDSMREIFLLNTGKYKGIFCDGFNETVSH